MSQRRIGLALSGGGARGFAHVGVLKVLAEHRIPVDLIAGTSAGSIVGAALAAGMSVAEIEAMSHKVRWINMTRPSYSPRAFLSNAPMGRFLKRHLPVATFQQLSIPFAAVACDLAKGTPKVFKNEGDLIDAIRASCAVPGIFQPIRGENGSLLVDGGLVEPLPSATVRQMGADVVIGVDLLACGASFLKRPQTVAGMLFRSAMTLLKAASINDRDHADISIEPRIAHIRPDRLRDRKECQRLGELAAREMIPEIERILNRDDVR
jgi:NTE family protein